MAKTAIMKVWNVDLGLAVHVQAPNGRYIVIDLGSSSTISPLSFLWRKDVGYMVITHPHLDHISDIENISFVNPNTLRRCKEYTRRELLEGKSGREKELITKYCDFVEKYNAPVSPENDPETISPFDGLTATIFQVVNCDRGNMNNFSAIVVLKLGDAKIVVCGDNEKESLEELMKNEAFKKSVGGSCVLVAPHHGRESGYYEEFVDLVNPLITVISDTTKGATSVVEKYTAKSQGYVVKDKSTEREVERKCLTTRKDGNIEIEFGESDDPRSLGTLDITTHA